MKPLGRAEIKIVAEMKEPQRISVELHGDARTAIIALEEALVDIMRRAKAPEIRFEEIAEESKKRIIRAYENQEKSEVIQ